MYDICISDILGITFADTQILPMKKVILILLAAGALLGVAAIERPTPMVVSENVLASSLKIINDTDQDIRIHTGSGHVMLNHGGGSTSVSCEPGKKISYSNGSKPLGLIFTIEENMCGKTVKLSTYID